MGMVNRISSLSFPRCEGGDVGHLPQGHPNPDPLWGKGQRPLPHSCLFPPLGTRLGGGAGICHWKERQEHPGKRGQGAGKGLQVPPCQIHLDRICVVASVLGMGQS